TGAGGTGSTPMAAASHVERSELPPPEAAKLCLATARSMDREGRVPDAIDLYVKTRQLDPAQTSLSPRLAVLYDRNGDFGQAEREYQDALRQAPRDATIYNDFGYSCYCRGRLPEAEQALRKALELDPKQERSWVNLGLVLASEGRYGDA